MNITKTELLNILSHPTRMRIIEVLFDSESSVSRIVEETGLEQTRVSHQLATLKKYKIADSRVSGKSRIWSLNQDTIVEIIIMLDEHLILFENE